MIEITFKQIIILILSIPIYNLGVSQEVKLSDLENNNLKGRINSIEIRTASFNLRFGNWYEDDSRFVELTEFNYDGFIVFKRVADGEITLNKFDEYNNKIESSISNSNKDVKYIWEYNDYKRMTEESMYLNDKLDNIVKYYYDENKNIIESDKFNNRGDYEYKIISEINNNYGKKKLRRELNKFYNSSGINIKTSEYLLDQNNKKIEDRYFTSVYTSSVSVTIIKYIYSSNNLLTKKKISYFESLDLENNKLENIIKELNPTTYTEIGFDKNGLITKDSKDYYKTSVQWSILSGPYMEDKPFVEYRKEYKYDKEKNLIDENIFENGDSLHLFYSYTYDQNNNWINKFQYKKVKKFDKEELEPILKMYRIITYF